MALQLHDLTRSYGAARALEGVSLELPDSSVLGLLGPSGSGKSTMLRLIAGLEQPERGTIRFAGRDLTGVPAQERNFGLVFQDYALFPHLDVEANIAFGLVERGWPAARRRARVAAREIARANTGTKNKALHAIADALERLGPPPAPAQNSMLNFGRVDTVPPRSASWRTSPSVTLLAG